MLVRSTLFSRLKYMSQQTTEVTSSINTVQKQIATGKRISRLSEEPWSVAQMHQLREEKSLQSHYQSAANQSMGLLYAAEDSLNLVENIITGVKMRALQMSNETYTADQLDDVVEELTNMKERTRGLLNADFNGRFVFGGTKYDTEPYDSTYSYLGSNTEVSIDVSDTASVEVGFDGSAVFVNDASTDIFTLFDSLITGLNTQDEALINGAIDDFDEVFDNVNEFRTRLGSEMNIADDMRELSENIELRLTERLSAVEDVDIAEAMTRFTMLKTQYEINLQLTSKTRSISLFERM